MRHIVKILLLLIAAAASFSVHCTEVAGVKLDDTVQVANTTLKLNGAGVRYKVFFKVYVASLYLIENKNTADGVLGLAGPKQLNLTMLRDLSSDTLAQAFLDGVKRNSDKVERTKFLDQFLKLGQLFSTVPELKKGDTIAMEWIPNSGTTVFINGKHIGDVFPDVVFFNALLKIWLGENPVDGALKNQMLGISSNRSK